MEIGRKKVGRIKYTVKMSVDSSLEQIFLRTTHRYDLFQLKGSIRHLFDQDAQILVTAKVHSPSIPPKDCLDLQVLQGSSYFEELSIFFYRGLLERCA
jgi:hypothetical protein